MALLYKLCQLINAIIKKYWVIVALYGFHKLYNPDSFTSELNCITFPYFKAFAVINVTIIHHFTLSYNYLRFAACLYQVGRL